MHIPRRSQNRRLDRCGWLWLIVLALRTVPGLAAAPEAEFPPDAWITNAFEFPPGFSAKDLRPAQFETFRAEAVAGRLMIRWSPPPGIPPKTAVAHLSFDKPGHWPARDWRAQPMSLQGALWETSVLVTDLELPLVYFLSAGEAGATRLSAMRVCRPGAAGLDEPTRVFWPFLEGFEEGLESWHLLSPGAPPLRTDSAAHTGQAALRVSMPVGRSSVTVATTRLRGWHVWKQNGTGVRVWLRARSGEGRVRFNLLAHAYTSDQVVGLFPGETRLTSPWQKVDLPFSLLPDLPLPAVDCFTFEFLGEGPCEFLVDDVQLLGPWASDP